MRGGDHRLVVLFFTVLLDLVGFGIVLPLLPLYARDFGADGLLTGLLVSIYSLVQLVMAPVWGRISDRIGRRPVLLLGLFGSGVAYLVFARADSLALLFLSRIVGGIGGSTIYHCGDTGLFSDMALIGELYRPEIAMVPIGDRFTMGPELASRAAELIKPSVAIPVHYDTWPPIEQDPSAFQPSGVQVKVMTPGEEWEYSV